MMYGHLVGKRRWFECVYAGCNDSDMLLVDVRFADGRVFRDHLWLPMGKRWRIMELLEGDVLRLRGKINRYYQHIRETDTLRERWEITNIDEAMIV